MRRFFKLNKPLHAALLGILLSAFSACDYGYLDGISSMEDYEYTTTLALPLVNSSFKIGDIIDLDELGSIEVDDEGMVSIVYRGRVFSLPASQIFQIPNQSQSFNISVNPSSKSEQVFDKIFLVTFDQNQVISWVKFLEGQFRVELTAPQLIADGYNISATFEILGSVSSSGGLVQGQLDAQNPAQVPLNGATLDFGNDANMFMVRYTVTVSGNGTPTHAPYTVDFAQNMTGLRYELLYGYIGEIAFPVGKTGVDLGLFRNANLGSIFFEAPNFRLVANNSYGTPIHLYFNDFFAKNKENETIDIENADVQNYLVIAAPAEPGITEVSRFVLDRSNTNIDAIMDIRPSEIIYDVSGLINPGNTPAQNFIRHDSRLGIDLEIDLPFWGRVDFFEISDTLDLSFDDLPEELEWIEIKLQMNNGFPLNAVVEVFFADENYNILTPLFANPGDANIIEAAPTNPPTQTVVQPVNKTTFIMIDDARLEHIRQASNILLQVRLLTYNQQAGESVKFLEDYELGIQMGARVHGRTTIELKPAGN